MELQSVSKKAKMLWMIGNVIWLIILTAAVAVGLMLCWDTGAFALAAAIGGVSWLILAVLLLIWPGLQYKAYAYGRDDKRLYLQRGVIFKHQITAPVCQIQDLHFYEGPIMRLFGLGKVMVSTGGSNFDISGLEKAQAQALIEELEQKLRARIEVRDEEI